jgi:hypothetical protein
LIVHLHTERSPCDCSVNDSPASDSVRSGGFPLIQAVPDLGHVPRQQLVHPSDRMIGDAFLGRWGRSGIHPSLPFRSASARARFSIAATVKLALIYSCSRPFALRLIMPHGALASLRGRRQPPHDGMRRMGRFNLWGALAAGQRQDRRTLRTRPTRRPREDIFLPKQNRYLLACSFPAFSAGSSGNRRNRGTALAPAELATINPHPVQNHG